MFQLHDFLTNMRKTRQEHEASARAYLGHEMKRRLERGMSMKAAIREMKHLAAPMTLRTGLKESQLPENQPTPEERSRRITPRSPWPARRPCRSVTPRSARG